MYHIKHATYDLHTLVANLVKKQLTKGPVVSKNKINYSNTSAEANIEQTLHCNDLSNDQNWIPLRTTKLTSHLVTLDELTHRYMS